MGVSLLFLSFPVRKWFVCLAYAIHVSPKTKEVLEYFKTFQLEQREDEVFLKVTSQVFK